MGATGVAGRLALRRSAAPPPRHAALLAFNNVGGPLVAVCGLVAGCGTSTLAHALAERAARDSAAPVLACEADPAAGALAVLAGAGTEHSFSDLATGLAQGDQPSHPFLTLPSGLRLIASTPRRRQPPGEAALPVLRDARAAHGLVVVDCGTVARPEALPALELATHILWTVPATALGLRRASAALGALAPPPGAAREALVCVAVAPTGVKAGAVRELAEPRCDRVVLVPHAPAVYQQLAAPAAELLGPTLVDLATVIRMAA